MTVGRVELRFLDATNGVKGNSRGERAAVCAPPMLKRGVIRDILRPLGATDAVKGS